MIQTFQVVFAMIVGAVAAAWFTCFFVFFVTLAHVTLNTHPSWFLGITGAVVFVPLYCLFFKAITAKDTREPE